MTDKLSTLHREWSLIDGQGLVRVVPVGAYREGLAVVAMVGALAEPYECQPDIFLSRRQVTITIDDANEDAAYRLAAAIDAALASASADADTES